MCVDSYGGHYQCKCRDGYRLGTDGKSCQGDAISVLVFVLWLAIGFGDVFVVSFGTLFNLTIRASG